MSSFYGLNIARSALFTAQKGIDVTGHNIANADRPGYTRQRLLTVAVMPPAIGNKLTSVVKGMTGGGVDVITVDQIRSTFLDYQYRQEKMLSGMWSERTEHLTYVENLFDEASDAGISKAMTQFLDGLQELSRNPTNKEYRTNFLQQALKLTETFHHYSNQLADKLTEMDRAAVTMTGQINDIAITISDLNVQIARYELSGQNANDLRDKRNIMLDQLSEIVDFHYEENTSGQLQVFIGDKALVDHDLVNTLSTVKDKAHPITGLTDSLSSIVWQDSQEELIVSRGTLKAVLDMRDGDNKDNIGLPYLAEQLDILANALVTSFNEVHKQGWSLPDELNGIDSLTGLDFFVQSDELGNPLPVKAGNISVEQAVIDNVNLIAAASSEIVSAAHLGNNENILDLINLFNRKDLPEVASYSGFVQSFIGTLAIEVSHAKTRDTSQTDLLTSLDQQRESIAGVSLDEEMTYLIRMQHSFSAASRMINTIDACIDQLVNRTGMVGR